MTKEILYERQVADWKLFGKTGSGFESNGCLLAWYVGWLESENGKYIFALFMNDLDTFPSKEERQQLVVKLFFEKGIDLDH
jgi:beta-lactamase class D